MLNVRIGHLFDGFRFEEDPVPDHKVRVVIMRQDDSFVGNFVIFLAQKRNSSATQFNDQSILVDDFIVAFSQLTMNLHAQADGLKDLLLVKQLIHSCELVKFVSLSTRYAIPCTATASQIPSHASPLRVRS